MYLQPFESVDVVGVVKEEELGRKNQHYVQKECRSLWVDKAIRWIKMESRWGDGGGVVGLPANDEFGTKKGEKTRSNLN